jgi:hypothetical protein
MEPNSTMQVPLPNGVVVSLLNFAPSEHYSFLLATQLVGNVLASKAQFPTLKSNIIHVFRNLNGPPLYVVNSPCELISLHVEENKPFQFIYQFAHEMAHLMAQAGRRFGNKDRRAWIEEAICGAYSVFCMREATTHSQDWFRSGANDYLNDYINKNYSSTVTIDEEWYRENLSHLVKVDTLTDTIKPLSRLIADELSGGEFISNNVALVDTPLTPSFSEYLRDWESRCAGGKNVPKLLRERFGNVAD